ncbi:MAG: hypothetical protein PHI49_08530 [Halothiobacillaceae bacterium]|jgi:predicted transcriptional regulator|nr:hypothetical protein [Halothiobacillaceae bacterium]MDY0050172.1 hypothetical protein [Halothiobacillaceae bacterium]
MNEHILHVHVAEPLAKSLARAAETMEALERQEAVEPYLGIGFADVGRMLAVLTPRRWDLIAMLREKGPMNIAEVARVTGRNYKNVHQDILTLMEWHILDRDEEGHIHAPFDELVLDVKLPGAKAA